jgi:hypothetical protein
VHLISRETGGLILMTGAGVWELQSTLFFPFLSLDYRDPEKMQCNGASPEFIIAD